MASELLHSDPRSCLSALRCLPSEQLSRTDPCPRWAVEERLSLAAEIPQPWCVRAVGPYGVMRGRRRKLTWSAERPGASEARVHVRDYGCPRSARTRGAPFNGCSRLIIRFQIRCWGSRSSTIKLRWRSLIRSTDAGSFGIPGKVDHRPRAFVCQDEPLGEPTEEASHSRASPIVGYTRWQNSSTVHPFDYSTGSGDRSP